MSQSGCKPFGEILVPIRELTNSDNISQSGVQDTRCALGVRRKVIQSSLWHVEHALVQQGESMHVEHVPQE